MWANVWFEGVPCSKLLSANPEHELPYQHQPRLISSCCNLDIEHNFGLLNLWNGYNEAKLIKNDIRNNAKFRANFPIDIYGILEYAASQNLGNIHQKTINNFIKI